MFKFNLASFDSVLETELKLTKSDIRLTNGIEIENELMLRLVFTKDTPYTVIVQAEINGELAGACARCLKPIITPVNSAFTVIFKRKDMMDSDDIESDMLPFTDNEIDIYTPLSESMLLAMPMKLLCAEDCRGLCPVCGKNLNEEQCGHKVDLKNNPFSGLDPEKFKRKTKEE